MERFETLERREEQVMNFRTISILFRVSILLLLVAGVGGCATYGEVMIESEPGLVTVEGQTSPGQSHYQTNSPKIPPGHMPPPGKCRIWFPGEPPGKQPPPGDCMELEQQIPPGAWLIRG